MRYKLQFIRMDISPNCLKTNHNSYAENSYHYSYSVITKLPLLSLKIHILQTFKQLLSPQNTAASYNGPLGGKNPKVTAAE